MAPVDGWEQRSIEPTLPGDELTLDDADVTRGSARSMRPEPAVPDRIGRFVVEGRLGAGTEKYASMPWSTLGAPTSSAMTSKAASTLASARCVIPWKARKAPGNIRSRRAPMKLRR